MSGLLQLGVARAPKKQFYIKTERTARPNCPTDFVTDTKLKVLKLKIQLESLIFETK